MKIKTKMWFLGKKAGKSKESGNQYYIVRMQDENDNSYDWYVPFKDNEVMIDAVEKAKKFTEYQVLLELSSYQGKPRIDLVGLAL
jgi:hypothetical protein